MNVKLTNALVLMGLTALPIASPWIDDAATAAKGGDVAAQVRALGSDDADTRQAAFDALEKMGEAARPALEQAKKSSDAETRFSAALLLDRLDGRSGTRDRAMESVGGGRGWLRDAEENDDRADPAQESKPQRGVVRRSHRAWPAPFDPTELERQIEQMHQEMLRRLNDVRNGVRPSSEQHSARQSMSMRIDADGRVVADVERDGKREHYEADSVDALRAEHPELFENFGEFSLQDAPPMRGVPQWRGAARRPLQIETPRGTTDREPQDATRPRLGVQVEPVPEAVVDYLELEDGVGLHVVDVVAGSTAETLGIRRNDLLVEVNGRTIRGIADVQAALGKESAKNTAKETHVTVLRKGVKLEL